MKYKYEDMFGRNIGNITEEERAILRKTKIAILGQGGVGGGQTQCLARLGCEELTIADNGIYDEPDLNRQYSSDSTKIGKNKAQCVKEAILNINPDINLTVYDKGVTEENYKSIVDNNDVILNELDFNVLALARLVYEYAYEVGKPVITTPLAGIGAVSLVFQNGKSVSFDEYCGITKEEQNEKKMKFLIGKALYPNFCSYEAYNDKLILMLQGKSHIPSSAMAGHVAHSLGTMALINVVCRPERVRYAPCFEQVDLYDKKYYLGKYNWYTKLKQILKIMKYRKLLGK
ncbi:ThiF family adenylyltransferase [Candidatus Margulisiibacteriota bacterium]